MSKKNVLREAFINLAWKDVRMAEKIIEKTGSKSSIVFETLPKDDLKQRKPDITSAMHLLKWHPIIDLDDGLEKTIAYFRETHGQVAI